MLLSIIIPIFNREKIINNLYNNIKSFDFKDIEIIIVDDGSTDNTYEEVINKFYFSKSTIRIYKQENSGPGGAKNKGLQHSTGKYIWFVDSDDFINIEAYFFLHDIKCDDYDFIDYNYVSKGKIISSIDTRFEEGKIVLDNETSSLLKVNFGRIWTKIYSRDFLISNRIFFAENCFYEDNYLLFSLPNFTSCFYKTNICAYTYNEDLESVTRMKSFNPKFYDRLLTIHQGLIKILSANPNHIDIDIYTFKYTQIFLVNTIRYLLTRFIKRLEFSNLKRIKVVIDIFETENAQLGIGKLNHKIPLFYKLIIFSIKLIFLPQSIYQKRKMNISYFYDINKKEWKYPIKFPNYI